MTVWIQLPAVAIQHDDSELKDLHILLELKMSVGGQQYIKPGLFGGAQEFAVQKRTPPLLRSGSYFVAWQEFSEWDWSSLVKQNKHQRGCAGTDKLCAAKSRTALT